MTGTVIYASRYGATRQYAEWIGKHLNLAVSSTDLIPDRIPPADFYIVGSPVYMGKLAISKWLKQNEIQFRNKKMFLFIVGGTRLDDSSAIAAIIRENLPGDKTIDVDTFYLPGRMIKSSLSVKDNFMLRMGAVLTDNKEKRAEMLTDFDEVKREHMQPLISAVESFTLQVQPTS